MTQTAMDTTQKHVSETKGSAKTKKTRAGSQKPKNHETENGEATDLPVTDNIADPALQKRLSRTADSDSQDSSSPAFADPAFSGVGDDLSESDFSDLDALNFEHALEWPDGVSFEDPALLTSQNPPNTPLLEKAAAKLLLYQEENPDMKSVDPQTQARLEALLEAAGIGKLSTAEGKAFADPEVLRKLTSSVSCALDEAAAALTRMRAESQSNLPQSDRTLAEACSEGDIEAVKRLLDEGRSVHETTEEGESLLSLACSAGYYELAEVLLRMRANVEDRGIKGDCTPLMEAASGGFVEIVKLLIAYQADVNAQSSAGHTALHHAAVGGYEDVVQALIDAGANVEEQNENGHTPLMEAASAGHTRVAQILLDSGAGINTHSNEFKESALTLACYKGHLDMVKFLLDAGADQEHKTDEMHTALMEASMDGHVEVARLLLDSGAQVNMPADSFESPLTLAACGGHVELANLLIERGANLEEVNDEGYTPLMEAAREGHEEMVALLLAHGADVNSQTEETQETALTLACCGGFLEVAHLLIRAGTDIELGCSTPLMEAAQEGHIDLVKYLIKQKANVQAVTGTGDSALTYACENGHTDVADILLQSGAKLEHESEGGRTPLMKAARAGHMCTVRFLIAKGADVNRSTTNNDHTALSLACAGGHLNVVELLLEKGADPLHKLKDGSTMLIEAAKGGHTNVVNLLLDYPQVLSKTSTATTAAQSSSSDYPEVIPMADGLAADLEQSSDGRKTSESLAARLEQFIHRMMSQAENSSGTKEEQMARKQEILEELQRVEQELKFRTQMAQLENQPISGLPPLDGQEDSPVPPPPTSLSSSPPNFLPTHEYVMSELQQKQMTIQEQQKHEQKLQQQKEFYQAKLQALKHQYQQKQLQLQKQRQRLLSETANNNLESSGETAKRQPIPLHIALQNHLYAHHVTEGNVNDLAQALQDWDTRDRNISLPANQVKPMPAFNLSTKHEEDLDPPAPLPIEDLALPETPASRPLADSLATLIHSKDSRTSPSSFDSKLKRTLDSKLESTSDYEMTMKTLEWLKTVDASCAPVELNLKPSKPTMTDQNAAQTSMMTVPKPIAKKNNDLSDKTSATKITKVPNGYVDQASQVNRVVPPIPSPQRSKSPARVPFVDPNAETESNHDTALTLACAGGHSELVRLLLNRNAEIEHRDKKGFTPLILASTAGHAEVVEILLEHGADIEAQSERTKDTPLSLACSGGRYEVVEILLRRLANKEHRNVSDYTPLSLAASGGYVNIIKLLLNYGAEINSRTGSKLGISPLMLAAMNGHTAAVKLLLDMGSDINAQIETNRNTALTLACFQGRHDVVSLLVDRRANIEHRAKTGLTPLMEAASGGYVDVGRVLLDKGADVNAPPVPSSKDTALTIAADKGHYRFVELLLSRGSAVDVKNKKGNSPLWLACNGGHLDVVQLLVSNSADIDSQDNRKVSALMTAFRKGHLKVVKWLVKYVAQFPSDKECARFIATATDKDLLQKCQSCMEVIVQAKEEQAKEAQKNADVLLEEIEFEKSQEEKRKEAAARKREKKKQKRKEKQVETHAMDAKANGAKKAVNSSAGADESNSRSSDQEEQEEDDEDDDGDGILSIVASNKLQRSNSSKKQTAGKGGSDKVKHDEGADKENASKKNRKNKEKQLTSNDGNTTAPAISKSAKPSNEVHKTNRKNVAPAPKIIHSNTGINDLDDFGEGDASVKPLSKSNGSVRSGTKRERGSSNQPSSGIAQLDSFDSHYPTTPNKHQTLQKGPVSPSPGKKKRDEGWKEVIRKFKKVSIPPHVVQRLSKQLPVFKEQTGAHMEFDKPEKRSGNRSLVIRGSTEAMKQACSLVTDFLKEQESRDAANAQAQNTRKSYNTSGANGTGSTQLSGTVSNATGDTMSSIGTFRISDFIVTTQQKGSGFTETKPKSVPSKSAWATVGSHQSPWNMANVPSAAAVVASSSQGNMSPKPLRAGSSQKPLTMAAAVQQQPKLPTEVSRQLFADKPNGPSTAPVAGPLAAAANTKPATTGTHQPSPLQRAPPPPQPAAPTSQPASVVNMSTNIAAPASSAKAPIARPQQPVAAPVKSYSPFEGQMGQQHLTAAQVQLSSSLPAYAFPSPSSVGTFDQSKAPGYRPSASPLSFPTQQQQHQQMSVVGEDMFSRHPYMMRPLPGAASMSMPGAHMMSGLSVATNIAPGYNFTAVKSNMGSFPTPTAAAMAHALMSGTEPQSLGFDRDQYTTVDQPMTLPRIPSSLNPNASEFTTSSRFLPENGMQHSPRGMAVRPPPQSSPVDLRPSPPASAYQPQTRLGNNLQQVSGQPGGSLADQNPYHMNMMATSNVSASLPGSYMSQAFNQMQPDTASHHLQQPLAPTSTAFSHVGMGLGAQPQQQPYSPRQMPQHQVSAGDMTKLDDMGGMGQGDGSGGAEGRSIRPIGMERPRKPDLFSTNRAGDIWSGGPGADWLSISHPNFFPSNDLSSFALHSGLPGGAGDNSHNTWSNSPSKNLQSDWSNWNSGN